MSEVVLNKFAERMHEVCNRLGIADGRGRISDLSRRFAVSPNAARKWLLGQGMPELAKAVEIANTTGVNVTWLLQGRGPRDAIAPDTAASTLGDAVAALGPSERQAVADFVRYKLERANVPEVNEERKRYLVDALDKIVLGVRLP